MIYENFKTEIFIICLPSKLRAALRNAGKSIFLAPRILQYKSLSSYIHVCITSYASNIGPVKLGGTTCMIKI